MAASSVDDIATAAAKAGSKTAGVVIDDAAVTPKYVQGFKPERELPIIWKIARGSLISKLVVLLPAAMVLNHFAPQAMTPLLMLGGSYLCFEGAEKIAHAIVHRGQEEKGNEPVAGCPDELEEEKVKGAVKTDFILSAEIMAISLAAIPKSTLLIEAGALALVGIGVTVSVYGAVALIIKMDDVGLHLAARDGRVVQLVGTGLVRGMPLLLTFLSVVGTAAMLWVGGNIVIHGLHELGMHHPYQEIHSLAVAAGEQVGVMVGFVQWLATAISDGILGLLYGLLLVALITKVIAPVWQKLRPKDDSP